MSDAAYDITYLLEPELVNTAPPGLRIVQARSASPRPPVVASAQDELARELMQNAEIHEALIRQYLTMAGGS